MELRISPRFVRALLWRCPWGISPIWSFCPNPGRGASPCRR